MSRSALDISSFWPPTYMIQDKNYVAVARPGEMTFTIGSRGFQSHAMKSYRINTKMKIGNFKIINKIQNIIGIIYIAF